MKIKPTTSDRVAAYKDAGTRRRLEEYMSQLSMIDYSAPEASLLVPNDAHLREQVESAIKWSKRDALRYVVVIGIGGSNLGTQAIYEAIGSRTNVELLFLDTTSDVAMEKCITLLENTIKNKDEVVVNVISKSGATIETIANFEVLYSYLSNRFGDCADRVVSTTGEGSSLWKKSMEAGFYALPIPELVGGRYSVFTAVGLFPLALAGIDIENLLDGAKEVLDTSLCEEPLESEAGLLALDAYIVYESGYVVHNAFMFDSRLESLGKWWRQLVGESLGKQCDVNQKKVSAGIVPLVSIGSVDLHSVGQLYLSGSRNIVTTFCSVQENASQHVPTSSVTVLGQSIGGKSFQEIAHAIYQGVVTAYKKKELPLTEILFEGMNEFEIGYYMQLKMLEIILTAELMQINAFDQPNVEDYKKETRKLLG